MQIYNVTPKALKVLREVAKLSARGAKELSDFLAKNLESLMSPSETYDLVMAQEFKNISTDTALQICDFIIPFAFEVLPKVADADEAANGLAASARQAANSAQEGPLSAAALKKLSANALSILDNPVTRLKAKALRLMNSHDLVFTGSQVYSDIRPVFKVDGGMDIEAAVVYHTLKITHTGTDGEFSVALDSEDLKILQKTIERAISKEQALSMLIGKAGIEQVKVS